MNMQQNKKREPVLHSPSHTVSPASLIPRTRDTSFSSSDPGLPFSLEESTLIEDEDSIYEIDPECLRHRKQIH